MTAHTRTRADLCPGVWRPWQADDGMLIRIRLLGGRIDGAALRRLSDVSARHGDGRIYLTARANLQLRGLPGDGKGKLASATAAAIEETGLIPSRSHELVRNVLVSPQTGLAGGRADLRPVCDRLDALVCANPDLGLLPGRFLFTLDDGRGDLLERLTGVGKRGTDLGCIVLGESLAQLRIGTQWGSVVDLADVAVRLAELAAAFVEARGGGADAPWHIRELSRPLRPPVAPDARIPAAAPALPYGDVPGGAHVAAQDGALTRDRVAALLDSTDAGYVVVTPWRGVLVPAVPKVGQ